MPDNCPIIHLMSKDGIFAIAGIEAHCGDLFFHVFTPYFTPCRMTSENLTLRKPPLGEGYWPTGEMMDS